MQTDWLLRRGAGDRAHGRARETWRAIMCVAAGSRRVQGFLVVEEIDAAFATARSARDGIITYDTRSRMGAELGIRGLWVHGSHRRAGIASRMVNAARASRVAGYMVPIDRCAFSQPTRDGQEFAEAYCGSREYLVYV